MMDLPTPVARFCGLASGQGPRTIETVAIETTAWMRRPWMPRIPLEIRMAHRLGYEFVHDIRIGRGPLSFRFGLDAYIAGHGLMKIGPSVQTGVTFDQGALIALWGEALCFPGAWMQRTDIRWAYCQADRYKATGPKVGWVGRYSDWRSFAKGVLAPGAFEIQWADEPYPWIAIRTKSISVDTSVDDALRLGTEAFRAVHVQRTGRHSHSSDGHPGGR